MSKILNPLLCIFVGILLLTACGTPAVSTASPEDGNHAAAQAVTPTPTLKIVPTVDPQFQAEIEAIGQKCALTQAGQVCFGQAPLKAEVQPERLLFPFWEPGHITNLADLQRLEVGSAGSKEGLALLLIQTENPGQAFTAVAFGDVELINQVPYGIQEYGGMQSMRLTTGPNEAGKPPTNGLLVQAPGEGKLSTLVVNGVRLLFGSTALLTSSGQTLTIHTLAGTVSASSPAQTIEITQGTEAEILLTPLTQPEGAELLFPLTQPEGAELIAPLTRPEGAELLEPLVQPEVPLEPLVQPEGAELLEPLVRPEVPLEPLVQPDGAELLEPLTQPEGAELLEPLTQPEGAELLEPLTRPDGAELLEPLTQPEGAELLQPLTRPEGAELLEPLVRLLPHDPDPYGAALLEEVHNMIRRKLAELEKQKNWKGGWWKETFGPEATGGDCSEEMEAVGDGGGGGGSVEPFSQEIPICRGNNGSTILMYDSGTSFDRIGPNTFANFHVSEYDMYDTGDFTLDSSVQTLRIISPTRMAITYTRSSGKGCTSTRVVYLDFLRDDPNVRCGRIIDLFPRLTEVTPEPTEVVPTPSPLEDPPLEGRYSVQTSIPLESCDPQAMELAPEFQMADISFTPEKDLILASSPTRYELDQTGQLIQYFSDRTHDEIDKYGVFTLEQPLAGSFEMMMNLMAVPGRGFLGDWLVTNADRSQMCEGSIVLTLAE